jgi:predicted ATP-binding protein involved in virulence
MKSIRLENYRCFTDQSFGFKQGINLLVGDNASGKTTVLKALKSAMSSFFSGYSDEHTRFIGLHKSDFTETFSELSKINEKPITVSFDLSDIMEQEGNSNMTLLNKKSKTSVKGLKNISQWAKTLMISTFVDNVQKEPLPLFASFSTKDIHSPRRINQSIFKKYLQKPSLGYYECIYGDGFFSYWITRLLVLTEGGKGVLEIDGVKRAINKALGIEGCNVINTFSVRPLQGKVYYHLIDGREVDSENLSDGYTRLVHIVTDLAFRCMLLNQGVYGINAIEETRGTVLIDEIDLHLHPTLQSLVIKSLRKAFPNLQFIVTTHAPMVMSGIEIDDNNQIYHLKYSILDGYTVENMQAFGMDASTIIKTEFGMTPRDQSVQDALDELFSLIDQENIKEAQQKLEQMRSRFSDSLPELSKAETMINLIS